MQLPISTLMASEAIFLYRVVIGAGKKGGERESLHCMTRSFYIILPSKDYEKAMFCSYHRQFLQDKSEFWEPEQQQFSS